MKGMFAIALPENKQKTAYLTVGLDTLQIVRPNIFVRSSRLLHFLSHLLLVQQLSEQCLHFEMQMLCHTCFLFGRSFLLGWSREAIVAISNLNSGIGVSLRTSSAPSFWAALPWHLDTLFRTERTNSLIRSSLSPNAFVRDPAR